MPLKRSASMTRSTSPTSSSSSFSEPNIKRQKPNSPSSSLPASIKVHILEAKLDSQKLSELISLTESYSKRQCKKRIASASGESTGNLNLELCRDVREADVVVTAIQMWKRFERHVERKLAKKKAIVTPQWLLDSVKHDRAMPCSDYAALNDLPRREETPHNHPEMDDSVSTSPMLLPSLADGSSPLMISDKSGTRKLSHTARHACARASPLTCPNQELVNQLDVVRRSRALEGEDISALTYSRAIAVIKAYPRLITRRELSKEIPQLPYIGPKKSSMIREFVTQGFITESQTILASSRFRSLSAFTSIYGIGPTTAKKLYSLGLRTIQELERYYEIQQGTEDSEKVRSAMQNVVYQEGENPRHELMELSIRVALALRHDFAERIPRSEVEEIQRLVMAELDCIQKGCTSTIVGGYRRGKPKSNDVDIVITHPDPKKAKGFGQSLVRRLYERGLVTHVMGPSGFHSRNSIRTTKDSIEIVLMVFLLPPDGNRRRVHRRLDLIFAQPDVYWTAITGWTGSTMFERDLRLWCKERGLKFDSSGITRRHDSKRFFPKSEVEVFELLGLEWVDPTLRNADA